VSCPNAQTPTKTRRTDRVHLNGAFVHLFNGQRRYDYLSRVSPFREAMQSMERRRTFSSALIRFGVIAKPDFRNRGVPAPGQCQGKSTDLRKSNNAMPGLTLQRFGPGCFCFSASLSDSARSKDMTFVLRLAGNQNPSCHLEIYFDNHPTISWLGIILKSMFLRFARACRQVSGFARPCKGGW
jgi:hypothetical protein